MVKTKMVAPKLTPKRRENLAKLIINAATVIFGGLVVGSFLGGTFHAKVFTAGLVLYFASVIMLWWLEP